jgi:hypothetical protein
MDDWDGLARTLRSLHAVLLKRARAQYIRERGLRDEEVGPGELLMLATREESFAWLRSISELMTEIDELRDSADARQDDHVRAAVRGTVEGLLAPADGTGEATAFQSNYWRHVHADPEVTMAHAAVRQSLRSWPAGARGRAPIDTHLDAKRKRPRP